MMPLEQQVTSLEISRRLKEVGVKQESLFWWDTATFVCDSIITGTERKHGINYFSAFTVAELGEMLPRKISRLEEIEVPILGKPTLEDLYEKPKEIVDYFLSVWPILGSNDWWVHYEKIGGNRRKFFYIDATADTEADARGKCLIYLLENKLITL